MLRVLWNRDGHAQGARHDVNGRVYSASSPFGPFFVTDAKDARDLLTSGAVFERPWVGGEAAETPEDRASLEPRRSAGDGIYDETLGMVIYRNAANDGWLRSDNGEAVV